MKLEHPKLVDLLQRAYSAEKAAAYAYIGHARSLNRKEEKEAVRGIELDEWQHRENVLALMKKYGIPVSRYYEIKFAIIGRIISASCHVIGWFMPYFFAGKLESGNVCEYFVMMHYFHSLGIREHDEILYEMGMKEKEHEIYFLEQVKQSRLLPFFERLFSWGNKRTLNDVDEDVARRHPVESSHLYCTNHPGRKSSERNP
jgi:hypothetical protein